MKREATTDEQRVKEGRQEQGKDNRKSLVIIIGRAAQHPADSRFDDEKKGRSRSQEIKKNNKEMARDVRRHYSSLLDPLKFQYVEKFGHHHYWKSSSTPTRQQVKDERTEKKNNQMRFPFFDTSATQQTKKKREREERV